MTNNFKKIKDLIEAKLRIIFHKHGYSLYKFFINKSNKMKLKSSKTGSI